MSPINSLSKGYNSNSPKNRDKGKIVKKILPKLSSMQIKPIEPTIKKEKKMDGKVSTLSKGYKSDIQNTRVKKDFINNAVKVNFKDISDKIKLLYDNKNLTKDDINSIIKDLKTNI